HEMRYFINHTAKAWCIFADNGLMNFFQSQRFDGFSLFFIRSNQTVCEGDFQLFSHRIPSFSYSSSTDFPRSLATSSGRFELLNPVIVARMTLIGVFDASDVVNISPTPESSITARTEPPARTPAASAAGFINTFPEPSRPWSSWGIGEPTIGTTVKLILALSIASLMAPGTSLAFPVPKPRWPFLSPTTT